MRLYVFLIVTMTVGCSMVAMQPLDLIDNKKNSAVNTNIETCQCKTQQFVTRDDYTYTPGIGVHKLHTKGRTWNRARKICIEEGGHLAIINSKRETKILKDMLIAAENKVVGAANTLEAFVGLHDLYEEGDWVTIFGEPLNSTGFSVWSTRWGHQEPDNSMGNQNCGALAISGDLDDTWCDINLAYFCELPLDCNCGKGGDFGEVSHVSAA